MKHKVFTLIIFVILFAVILGCVTYKPDIHTATYDELTEINGIGDTLANRVLSYLETNKTCSIEDLDDVLGIGPGKLELINRKFGD